jgi:hypothetical protein
LRAVRASTLLQFLQLFSNEREKIEMDYSGHMRTKQLKILSLQMSVDVRQSPRYASLKAETGVRFP